MASAVYLNPCSGHEKPTAVTSSANWGPRVADSVYAVHSSNDLCGLVIRAALDLRQEATACRKASNRTAVPNIGFSLLMVPLRRHTSGTSGLQNDGPGVVSILLVYTYSGTSMAASCGPKCAYMSRVHSWLTCRLSSDSSRGVFISD